MGNSKLEWLLGTPNDVEPQNFKDEDSLIVNLQILR